MRHVQEVGSTSHNEAESKKHPKLRKMGCVLGILAVSAAGLVSGIYEGIADKNTGEFMFYPKYAIGYGYTEVSPSQLEKVKHDLNEPADGGAQRIYDKGIDFLTDDTINNTNHHFDFKQNYDNYVCSTANRLNFTLVNDINIYKTNIEEAETAEQVIDIFNDYLSNFNMTISCASYEDIKIDQLDYDQNLTTNINEMVNSPEELNQLKEAINFLMEDWRYRPVELIELAEVKELKLTDGPPTWFKNRILNSDNYNHSNDGDLSKIPALGVAVANNNHLYMNIHGFNGEALTHEIVHHIDHQTTGVWFYGEKDPDYNAINPAGFKYGVHPELGQQNLDISGYSGTNVLEDKATVLEMCLRTQFGIAHQNYSIEGQKALLLLARLEHKLPGISEYYGCIYYQ